MAFLVVHAPLQVTSYSLTALQQSVAKMHRVKQLLGFEPGFPHPKLHVRTGCDRYLVGLPMDDRPKAACRGCAVLLDESFSVTLLPTWLSLFSGPRGSATPSELFLQDWRTGKTGKENR